MSRRPVDGSRQIRSSTMLDISPTPQRHWRPRAVLVQMRPAAPL